VRRAILDGLLANESAAAVLEKRVQLRSVLPPRTSAEFFQLNGLSPAGLQCQAGTKRFAATGTQFDGLIGFNSFYRAGPARGSTYRAATNGRCCFSEVALQQNSSMNGSTTGSKLGSIGASGEEERLLTSIQQRRAATHISNSRCQALHFLEHSVSRLRSQPTSQVPSTPSSILRRRQAARTA